ncbi:hypothetical protein IGI04_020429 [Brassica rapa subsp. trilocularis]|uniref:MULE transposase domain-containing protein n=1 Tax=Brassica rapa subsp. trilocularis TaxID=1813537 RepID=A0ABQ7MJJ5_BRACM|nr:hypothetical protein IGI04_020429 [Brassica rapa subsp. trilocularis]
MDEYCMVMAGDWICGEDGKWNFFVDKQQMSRMVPFREGITLSELEANVMKEHQDPPVLLTNDGAVGFFSRHLKVGAPMNLFAKFDAFDRGNQSSRDDSRAKGYRTPAQAMKRKMFDDVWSSGKGGYVSSAASKIDNVVVEEDELLREVEKVEEKIRGESLRSNEGEPCETIDSDSSLADEVDDRDVRPRGYDKEFWAPFIREDNGGSDVVDKVFNAEDTTRRTYSCTTNNAFDHTVVAGGSSPSNAKTTAEPEDEKPQDVEIPEDISERILYPPITKRQAGRRRKTRIPSTGEFPVGKKTKVVTIRCGRCKMEGHNRTRCQNPI